MIAALSAGLAVGTARASSPDINPLLPAWTGPYGGVPPFDKARVEHLQPALEAGMAQQLAEVDRIAANPDPPTFDNTIAALERAGRTLDRVNTVYGIYTATLNDEAVQAIEREMSPRLAAFSDKITQNERLFARIAKVYATRETSGLTPEQQRLTWLRYTNFVRAGAKLDASAKARLSAINQQLATLYTRFGQNVLADETNYQLVIENEADLAGLPEPVRAGAAQDAAARGLAGKWVVANTRSSIEPFLTYSERRDLREQAWRMFVDRGDNGGKSDNNAIITEILALRAERAKLLGYPTHAHWRLENTMAKEPARAMALMEAVWTPAVARVREEVADMQAIADKEGAGIKIEPWDYRYYAEKVRKAKYDLDENEVTPYLQLENLREGMFHMARELFGFHFKPVDPAKVPVYHPDVRAWEVNDPTGKLVGLWYFDPYARKGKRSGAWMNAYRTAGALRRRGEDHRLEQLELREGQARRAGADQLERRQDAVPRVRPRVARPELERRATRRCRAPAWRATTSSSRRSCSSTGFHARDPRPLRAALPDRQADPARWWTRSGTPARFNQGFDTVEYLSSALIDMKLHLAGAQAIDPDKFERETLVALGMPSEIVMRHRTPQFGHVFAGDGYSAGYYSYLWSDTLTADAWEAFTEAGGPWDKSVAKRLNDNVFSVGNTIDPADGYRAFRGRDAGIGALMRKRGFPEPK